ncbi:uncharacterized protein MONOS_876 [Monocercomonoides exilis]|uniref:uncharacterized protein n=1 Tax=Monocercomonoides exilis TaxID=2049356 RepID=UPI003559FA23|nr:hypothetical protein MONOS_876 [Monocercomonoides exilis]|eukprot:MONOS_876.1-p1 / transcript=MONOS_876.1 / gene=MONOS_876 / organism=Monocercomonoides_exilis_PA203 / gene_product=unspecified product / transcript_product=unspecified product / location=Mono_scaffold00014:182872-187539(-) / protein_length=1556 / sequence_SO=supercontig / SO=protein_coding / is_pseudo=false
MRNQKDKNGQSRRRFRENPNKKPPPRVPLIITDNSTHYEDETSKSLGPFPQPRPPVIEPISLVVPQPQSSVSFEQKEQSRKQQDLDKETKNSNASVEFLNKGGAFSFVPKSLRASTALSREINDSSLPLPIPSAFASTALTTPLNKERGLSEDEDYQSERGPTQKRKTKRHTRRDSFYEKETPSGIRFIYPSQLKLMKMKHYLIPESTQVNSVPPHLQRLHPSSRHSSSSGSSTSPQRHPQNSSNRHQQKAHILGSYYREPRRSRSVASFRRTGSARSRINSVPPPSNVKHSPYRRERTVMLTNVDPQRGLSSHKATLWRLKDGTLPWFPSGGEKCRGGWGRESHNEEGWRTRRERKEREEEEQRRLERWKAKTRQSKQEQKGRILTIDDMLREIQQMKPNIPQNKEHDTQNYSESLPVPSTFPDLNAKEDNKQPEVTKRKKKKKIRKNKLNCDENPNQRETNIQFTTDAASEIERRETNNARNSAMTMNYIYSSDPETSLFSAAQNEGGTGSIALTNSSRQTSAASSSASIKEIEANVSATELNDSLSQTKCQSLSILSTGNSCPNSSILSSTNPSSFTSMPSSALQSPSFPAATFGSNSTYTSGCQHNDGMCSCRQGTFGVMSAKEKEKREAERREQERKIEKEKRDEEKRKMDILIFRQKEEEQKSQEELRRIQSAEEEISVRQQMKERDNRLKEFLSKKDESDDLKRFTEDQPKHNTSFQSRQNEEVKQHSSLENEGQQADEQRSLRNQRTERHKHECDCSCFCRCPLHERDYDRQFHSAHHLHSDNVSPHHCCHHHHHRHSPKYNEHHSQFSAHRHLCSCCHCHQSSKTRLESGYHSPHFHHRNNHHECEHSHQHGQRKSDDFHSQSRSSHKELHSHHHHHHICHHRSSRLDSKREHLPEEIRDSESPVSTILRNNSSTSPDSATSSYSHSPTTSSVEPSHSIHTSHCSSTHRTLSHSTSRASQKNDSSFAEDKEVQTQDQISQQFGVEKLINSISLPEQHQIDNQHITDNLTNRRNQSQDDLFTNKEKEIIADDTTEDSDSHHVQVPLTTHQMQNPKEQCKQQTMQPSNDSISRTTLQSPIENKVREDSKIESENEKLKEEEEIKSGGQSNFDNTDTKNVVPSSELLPSSEQHQGSKVTPSLSSFSFVQSSESLNQTKLQEINDERPSMQSLHSSKPLQSESLSKEEKKDTEMPSLLSSPISPSSSFVSASPHSSDLIEKNSQQFQIEVNEKLEEHSNGQKLMNGDGFARQSFPVQQAFGEEKYDKGAPNTQKDEAFSDHKALHTLKETEKAESRNREETENEEEDFDEEEESEEDSDASCCVNVNGDVSVSLSSPVEIVHSVFTVPTAEILHLSLLSALEKQNKEQILHENDSHNNSYERSQNHSTLLSNASASFQNSLREKDNSHTSSLLASNSSHFTNSPPLESISSLLVPKPISKPSHIPSSSSFISSQGIDSTIPSQSTIQAHCSRIFAEQKQLKHSNTLHEETDDELTDDSMTSLENTSQLPHFSLSVYSTAPSSSLNMEEIPAHASSSLIQEHSVHSPSLGL